MYKINLSTGQYDLRDIQDCAKGYYIETEDLKKVYISKTHQDELLIREAMKQKPICPICGNSIYTKRFTTLNGMQVMKCTKYNCNTTFNQ